MSPFKTFTAGETLTASDVNTYLAKQAVIVCTSGTRPSSPVDGMVIYETDTDKVLAYDGTNWLLPANVVGGTLPGGYAETTTSQTGISTETDLTSLSVTVTVGAGRRIRITSGARVSVSVANDGALLRVKEGTAQFGDCPLTLPVAGRAGWVRAEATIAPSAGSHTYKATLARFAGTGTVGTDAGAGFPAWIRVEDVGV